MAINEGFYATGRRKESTARVWLKAGNGTMVVNGRSMDEYFGRETSKMVINQPLQMLE
jgi:small subunit ribosomal protein S9